MSRTRPPRRWLHALALCAVVLLNAAVVKSALMQAATGAAAQSCREPMAGMERPAHPGKADHRACAYCAAAAHAPVCAAAPGPAPPVAVAWLRWAAVATAGARGPPRLETRARGPPAPPQRIL